MQAATRGELENCPQCGGQMCLRPDRICCSACGLPLEKQATKGEAPAAPKPVAKHAAHAEPVGAPHSPGTSVNGTSRKK